MSKEKVSRESRMVRLSRPSGNMTISVTRETWMTLRIAVSTSLDTYSQAVEKIVRDRYPGQYELACKMLEDLDREQRKDEGTDGKAAFRKRNLSAGRRPEEKAGP